MDREKRRIKYEAGARALLEPDEHVLAGVNGQAGRSLKGRLGLAPRVLLATERNVYLLRGDLWRTTQSHEVLVKQGLGAGLLGVGGVDVAVPVDLATPMYVKQGVCVVGDEAIVVPTSGREELARIAMFDDAARHANQAPEGAPGDPA